MAERKYKKVKCIPNFCVDYNRKLCAFNGRCHGVVNIITGKPIMEICHDENVIFVDIK